MNDEWNQATLDLFPPPPGSTAPRVCPGVAVVRPQTIASLVCGRHQTPLSELPHMPACSTMACCSSCLMLRKSIGKRNGATGPYSSAHAPHLC